jgi:hypothetical protein
MFNRIKDKIWNDGTQWGVDTFAWTVETMLLEGETLEKAYEDTKAIYVNKADLQSRLDAWKENHVQFRRLRDS